MPAKRPARLRSSQARRPFASPWSAARGTARCGGALSPRISMARHGPRGAAIAADLLRLQPSKLGAVVLNVWPRDVGLVALRVPLLGQGRELARGLLGILPRFA